MVRQSKRGIALVVIGMDDREYLRDRIVRQKSRYGMRQDRLTCHFAVLFRIGIAIGARSLTFAGCHNDDGDRFWRHDYSGK